LLDRFETLLDTSFDSLEGIGYSRYHAAWRIHSVRVRENERANGAQSASSFNVNIQRGDAAHGQIAHRKLESAPDIEAVAFFATVVDSERASASTRTRRTGLRHGCPCTRARRIRLERWSAPHPTCSGMVSRPPEAVSALRICRCKRLLMSQIGLVKGTMIISEAQAMIKLSNEFSTCEGCLGG
jgi:hypothetical protein